MVACFNQAEFFNIIELSKKLQGDFYKLMAQIGGATTGKRLALGLAIYELILANNPQVDKAELRYFCDIITNTVAYQASKRAEYLTQMLGNNSWFVPPRNLQREALINKAFDREIKLQETNEKLYADWVKGKCVENKEIETKLSYNQAFSNAFGSRAIVHKDLEHHMSKQVRALEKEEEVVNDMNDVLLSLGQK